MPKNIATDAQAFKKDAVANKLPSLSHVRSCRRKIRIACESIVAFQLEKASK